LISVTNTAPRHLDVGEGGVLDEQVGLGGHDVGFGEFDRVLHATFGGWSAGSQVSTEMP